MLNEDLGTKSNLSSFSPRTAPDCQTCLRICRALSTAPRPQTSAKPALLPFATSLTNPSFPCTPFPPQLHRPCGLFCRQRSLSSSPNNPPTSSSRTTTQHTKPRRAHGYDRPAQPPVWDAWPFLSNKKPTSPPPLKGPSSVKEAARMRQLGGGSFCTGSCLLLSKRTRE